jgi:hypothetical protein
LGKVININSTGKERNILTRGIVAALRELMKQNKPDAHSYDLVSFIGLSLLAIDKNVEQSVVAWEKRDYWVKADRFRMEWSWAKQLGYEILISLDQNDWARIAINAAKAGQKLAGVKVTERSRIGTPWAGAWDKYKKVVKQSED